ncbi:hypothetical protein [Deinococcus peraridilitoris]|uniref:Uncharacterized protein n=1 Tax=Deinococcus peraridilitoris (strain DSM 19664 / LMG 22246 / CIP 109416 / KR-200) TaxID=937777 RepID=K9ZZK1_DEIPD|nr:hypothetical protein [Deinococcus peraridilitoris]AFZ67031.1 hypothetical protein Deipe_1490 [Deinococcus peraridilitoris DSM 19664]
MDDLSTPYIKQPRPGVIFERSNQGEQVILNSDLTVTIVKDGESRVTVPSFEQWDTWAVDAFDAMVGIAPHIKLGEVGLRMGENYEVRIMAARNCRSDYAA